MGIMRIPSSARGLMQIDWLKSMHTFSFGDYFNPEAKGFRALRVINEDWVAAGKGFPQHGHRDMEILTWILEGALEHRDTLGNVARIEPGQIQRMSAGRGIEHSEWNAEKTTTHLLQIWIRPNRVGLAPTYDQKTVDRTAAQSDWLVVAAPAASETVVRIHQDARVLYGEIANGHSRDFSLGAGRGVWVHVISGSGTLEGSAFSDGDGFGIDNNETQEKTISISSKTNSKILLFDLP